MEITQGTNPLNKIITINASKKIGKFSVDYNKINNSKIIMHDGHKDCINQLRLAGMEIIILEFFNTSNIYKYLGGYGKVVPLVDQVKVLDNCIAENLDVDYIIYDSDDFKTDMNSAIIKLVDDRLIAEDYKNKLKISDFYYPSFRANLIFVTSRNYDGITTARSYKLGTDVFALKHYFNKYMNCDIIIVNPKMYNNINFPISRSIPEIELNEDAKSFLIYFYNIQKEDIINNPDKVKNDLEQYAISLGDTIEDFIILNDPIFIEAGKVFISVRLKNIYNVKIPVNRWI